MINYHLLQKRTPIENDKFKFKHFPFTYEPKLGNIYSNIMINYRVFQKYKPI